MSDNDTAQQLDPNIIERLARIEARLIAIEKTLDTLMPAPTNKRTLHITEIEFYISRSGNGTWKAYSADSEIIYLRQAHRALLTAAGIWDQLQAINYPGETLAADLQVDVVPDGDFWKPIAITGTVSDPEPADDDDDNEEGSDHLPADHPLAVAYRNRNFVILDTETAWLNGEVISLAIIDPDGKMLMNKLLRPTQPITEEAAAIHGLTNEVVANAAVFPDIVEELRTILTGKTIIAYNADYDRRVLVTTARLHNEYQMAQFIRESRFLDVMEPFAAIYGDWSDKFGSYTWQSLTTAAAHYGISTDHAHNALADCRMTLAVLKRMVGDAPAPTPDDEDDSNLQYADTLTAASLAGTFDSYPPPVEVWKGLWTEVESVTVVSPFVQGEIFLETAISIRFVDGTVMSYAPDDEVHVSWEDTSHNDPLMDDDDDETTADNEQQPDYTND